MATLADIVKRERSSGSSRTGALASAIGKKTLETIDPRRMFNQSGLLTSLFPSLKAYKADSSKSKVGDASKELSASTAPILEQVVTKLDGLDVTMRLVAKNTMTMPGMSRDMNVMRQNIGKLVKLQGGKDSTRADNFFLKAFEREKATEAELQAAKERRATGKTTASTTLKEKISGTPLIGPILAMITKPFFEMATNLQKFFDKFMDGIGNFFSIKGAKSLFGNILGAMTKSLGRFGIIFRSLAAGIGGTGFLAIAGLAALFYGLYKLIQADSGEAKTIEEMEKEGGYTPEQQSRAAPAAAPATDDEVKRARENMRKSEDPAVRAAAAELDRQDAIKAMPNESEAERRRLGLSASSPTPVPSSPSPSTSPTPMMNMSKQLLDIIAKGESGAASYEAMNQGGNKKTGIIGSGSSEKIIGKKLTDMTVSEILRRGKLPLFDKERIFAAGRYQIIPDTLQGLVNQGVVKPEDKFNEDTQDRLGRALIEQSGALKSATEGNLIEAQNRLSKVWAAIPSATTGQTALGGPNKADARLGQMIQASLSGQAVASASSTVDSARMAAMTPASIIPAMANLATPKAPSLQKQQLNIPSTIDADLFDGLVARVSEYA